jgi:DeoR/GlpR family transcriptional regulator of sugar metabolism
LQSPVARLGFDERQQTCINEKKEIARHIAAIIPDGQTVILDGGTTCYQVAMELKGRPLLVVTNSVPIAALLSGEVKTEITLIGGYLYPRTGVALGTMAEEMLKGLRAAVAVMSCAAVNPDGLFNANEMMASIERRMMEVVDEVIVGADHTKLSRRSIAKVCDLNQVDVLVTDSQADEPCRQWLAQGVKRLVVAEQQA